MANALTIADMSVLRSILETACDRGTFKAGEMRQVGEIYDKLNEFLNAIQAQAATPAPLNIGELPPAPTQGETNA